MAEHPLQGAERARERSCLGLTQETWQTRIEITKEPTGGSEGVPLYIRKKCVEHAVRYNVDSAAQKYDVSRSSVFRWMQRCLLYTSPSPRDRQKSRMPSSA